VCLAARRGHSLAKRGRLSAKDLDQVPWFVPFPYVQYRDEMQSIFRKINLAAPTNLVEASWNIAADYLRQSDAISILPYNLIADGLESGALMELETDLSLPVHPIGVIRREGVDLTQTAKELVREIRSCTAGRDKGAPRSRSEGKRAYRSGDEARL
jgi:DNA-binding transcriptional LysR family regulator